MNDQSTDGQPMDDARRGTIEQIVAAEWDMFQHTVNEGGRASCQGNKPMFTLMRTSQFMIWPDALLTSYLHDLTAAAHDGRNLVEEKYARMMASTEPERYGRDIAPYIPTLDGARIRQQERIIARQVAWARTFMEHYPHIGANMRVLTTDQDTPEQTSYETYLRGELGTYRQHTLDLYERFVEDTARRGGNIAEETVACTMRLIGVDALDEAERDEAERAAR